MVFDNIEETGYILLSTKQMKRWNGPCGDPYCYRGAEGSGFAGGAGRFKDGPCNSVACEWPLNLKSTSTSHPYDPTPPIVDAGRSALLEVKSQSRDGKKTPP